jgi:predicted phosphohydrolase
MDAQVKPPREKDRAKFVDLANKRVSKALNDIRLIGNLANKSNYDYTDDDVTRILRALSDEVAACRKRFELASKKTTGPRFQLPD